MILLFLGWFFGHPSLQGWPRTHQIRSCVPRLQAACHGYPYGHMSCHGCRGWSWAPQFLLVKGLQTEPRLMCKAVRLKPTPWSKELECNWIVSNRWFSQHIMVHFFQLLVKKCRVRVELWHFTMNRRMPDFITTAFAAPFLYFTMALSCAHCLEPQNF